MPRDRIPLSEVLLQKGLLTERDLIRALRHQLVYGGRLGTNLVELGYVRLDDLSSLLAAQRGVPEADVAALEEALPSVLERVDPSFCARNKVIPFRFDGRGIHLAMSDPDPDRVVALSEQLGRTVVPYVLPELRLLYFLERLYGVARPGRFLRDPERAWGQFQRRHYLGPTVSLAAASATARHLNLTRMTQPAGLDPFSAHDVMVFPALDELCEPEAPLPGSPRASSPEEELVFLDELQAEDANEVSELSIDVSELEAAALQPAEISRELARAESGAAIARLLVRPFLRETSASILFFVRDQLAVACLGAGRLRKPQMVPDLIVPIETSRLLDESARTKDCVRGRTDDDPLQILIAEYVGMAPPGEIAVMPVLLSGRLVHLLCIYASPGHLLPESTLAELRSLSEQTTWAYLRLIAALNAGLP
jgi:hypothetical protein